MGAYQRPLISYPLYTTVIKSNKSFLPDDFV